MRKKAVLGFVMALALGACGTSTFYEETKDEIRISAGFGGWLGTKLTVSWGPAFVRWVLLVVIVGASSRLLGLW